MGCWKRKWVRCCSLRHDLHCSTPLSVYISAVQCKLDQGRGLESMARQKAPLSSLFFFSIRADLEILHIALS